MCYPICCPSPCWHSYTSSRMPYGCAFWILKERKSDTRGLGFLFILFSGREHEHLFPFSISTDHKQFNGIPPHPSPGIFCLIPITLYGTRSYRVFFELWFPLQYATSAVVNTITVIRFTWRLLHLLSVSSPSLLCYIWLSVKAFFMK